HFSPIDACTAGIPTSACMMTKTDPPLIECTGLGKSYETIEAVSELGFELEESESASILGPSGCGKSTLLRLIAGLDVPDRGCVSLYGKEISTPQRMLPPEKRRFGMVFQDFALFPHMSVGANIAYGVRGSKAEKKKRVGELLDLISMPHLAGQMPHQLSGGEQQRVAVARSLAPRPRLILLDEPFSNLDYQLRVQLRRDIRDILRQQGVASLLVTHDQNEAITFSERMLLMNRGRLVQNGKPSEIYRYPKTLWAARFVGEANQLKVHHVEGNSQTPLGILHFAKISSDAAASMMIRPEEIHLQPPEKGFPGGSIVSIEFAGPVQNLVVRLDSGEDLRVATSPKRIWTEGESVSVVPEHFQCYDDSGERLDDEADLTPPT
ncbi:MAG: ABC transporter ATP-binding protein, partial [SAR324 cluster bacterium]|nr:ABC transporter ATP-binding protein [SAR324 cluster bacterium]